MQYPASELVGMGCSITYANPEGNRPPMDPHSNSSRYFASEAEYEEAIKFVSLSDPVSNLNAPVTLASLADKGEGVLEEFDLVLIPGGHAPLIDLWNSVPLGSVLRTFFGANRIVAAICHGPAALASTVLPPASGDLLPFPLKGANLTVFTTWGDEQNEKKWGGLLPNPPGYPAPLLNGLGATVIEHAPYSPFVVVDHVHNLITGQDPASAPEFARVLINHVRNSYSP